MDVCTETKPLLDVLLHESLVIFRSFQCEVILLIFNIANQIHQEHSKLYLIRSSHIQRQYEQPFTGSSNSFGPRDTVISVYGFPATSPPRLHEELKIVA